MWSYRIRELWLRKRYSSTTRSSLFCANCEKQEMWGGSEFLSFGVNMQAFLDANVGRISCQNIGDVSKSFPNCLIKAWWTYMACVRRRILCWGSFTSNILEDWKFWNSLRVHVSTVFDHYVFCCAFASNNSSLVLIVTCRLWKIYKLREHFWTW